MTRLWVALALLAALLAGALANARYLESFTGALGAELARAEALAAEGDRAGALETAEKALRAWEDRAFYLHVLFRHGDIDRITGGFRELLACLDGGEEGTAAFAGLRLELELLCQAERLSLKNVL